MVFRPSTMDVNCAISDMHDIMIAELKDMMACGGYVMPPYEKNIWSLSPYAPSDAYSCPARPNTGGELIVTYEKEDLRKCAEDDRAYMREKAEELQLALE